MSSNHGLTYCCWVGNIPGNIKKDLIMPINCDIEDKHNNNSLIF